MTWAGHPDGRVVAVVIGVSGPSLEAGPADLLLISEAPGSGIGAAYAGEPHTDPGAVLAAERAAAKIRVAGHATALWSLPVGPDRAVYVGEAEGSWLWCIAWPADAGYLVETDFALMDLQMVAGDTALPSGALADRLFPGSNGAAAR